MTDPYVKEYYERTDVDEHYFRAAGVLRPDQAAAIMYSFAGDRWPQLVASIGCGVGEMERMLGHLGIECVGVDGAEGAREGYQGNRLIPVNFCQFMEGERAARILADTWIFCQSLEHIPEADIREFMPQLSGRIIVVNRVGYHPIGPNGYDHITRVDEELMGWIASLGNLVFQYQSHLVVDVGD